MPLQLRGAVVLAALDWNFLRQRVHHLSTGLARAGLKVLFVENTAARPPRPTDLPRIIGRLRTALFRPADGGEPAPENLQVYSPLAAPWPYSTAALAWNYYLLRRRVQRFLEGEGLRPEEVVLLTYLATPLAVRLAEDFPWARVVYDVVSDPKLVEPRLAPFEERLLRRADVTLFASATLLDQYRDRTKNPVLFRDGFNTELLDAEVETPPEVARLPRPRLLYIGGINRKLWVEAVAALCEAVPQGSVILMGPVARGEVLLPKLPNLYVLPPRRRYIELAGVLRAADVGLIPYRPDPYAGAMHPAKLNEYLVFGLPVVATATEELELLSRHYGDGSGLILARTADGFVRSVEMALERKRDLTPDERQRFLKDRTWDACVSQLLDHVM